MDSQRRIATILFADIVGLASVGYAGRDGDTVSTVLFADVSGFTTMSETMDPEDVRDVMNECFTVLEAEVHATGGRVDQYLGDCIVAIFDAPDAPVAAVRAAVGMRARIATVAPSAGPLQVHVGIATGPARAGDVGGDVKRRATVVGPAVDTASLLKDVSPTGTIWVNEGTMRATGGAVHYRPVAAHGLPDGTAHEVVGVLAAPAPPVAARQEAAAPPVARTDAHAEMNRCFAIVERVVREHGGHVDKYVGAGVMALFGVPTALENAPRAALQAALSMRRALRDAARAGTIPRGVDLRLGLNTGLVMAGELGGAVTRDFTVMGDAVNLAARLKDASPVGEIWAGPQTYRYARDHFDWDQLRPLALKNKRQPVQAWSVRAARTGIREVVVGRDRMVFSALVGRERELEEIRECVERLLEGRGGIVSVVADAGLGKSRLMAEVGMLDEMRSVLRLEGRSLAVGNTFRFHPFVDMLKRWADIGEDDDDARTFEKLAAAVTPLLRDATPEVLPFVATLMGVRVPGEEGERIAAIEGDALEKLLLKALRDLFQAMATAWPLVLVLEDLHWADASSVGLLESLLRLAVDVPVLFIHAMRPERTLAVSRILGATREHYAAQHTEITLAPLDAKQCDRLIRNLLKIEDLPYATRALIARKADGNPFFIEEVVRSLIDEGAIEHVNGLFRVTEKIDHVVIPGTIQEVILTRVERLPERAQAMLRVSAVIGRSFPYRVLAAVMPHEPENLEWDLRQLQHRQLIVERKADEEIEYVFTHAIAQETIYESISQRARKGLHGEVAAAIERLYPDRLADFYGMLAYHYSRADKLVEAEAYLFKAGDEAARSAASSEALTFFQEASRLYFLIHGDGGDPLRKALLEKSIALALLNRGQLLDSLDHFDAALAHLGQPVPREPAVVQLRFVSDLAVLLARVYTSRGRPPIGRPRPTDREALEVRYNRHRAQSTSDPKRLFVDTVNSVRLLGRTDPRLIEQASGMYAAVGAAFAFAGISFPVARRILTIARALIREGSLRDEFVFRSFRFLVDYFAGDWSEEGAIEPALVEQGLRYGLAWDANTYLGLHCEQAIVQGNFDRAQADIARLTEMVDEYGFDFARSNQHFMTAYLMLEQRRLGPALEALERYAADRHEDALNVLALGTRARIELLTGAEAGAAATLARVEAMLPRLGIIPPYHLSAYTTSRLLYDVRVLEAACGGAVQRDARTVHRLARAARRSRRQALRLATRIARDQPQTFRLAARLGWVLGRPREAYRYWTRSLEVGARLGARPELGRVHQEIAQHLAEPGATQTNVGGLDAAGHAARARTILTELGLHWDLAQIAAPRRAA